MEYTLAPHFERIGHSDHDSRETCDPMHLHHHTCLWESSIVILVCYLNDKRHYILQSIPVRMSCGNSDSTGENIKEEIDVKRKERQLLSKGAPCEAELL